MSLRVRRDNTASVKDRVLLISFVCFCSGMPKIQPVNVQLGTWAACISTSFQLTNAVESCTKWGSSLRTTTVLASPTVSSSLRSWSKHHISAWLSFPFCTSLLTALLPLLPTPAQGISEDDNDSVIVTNLEVGWQLATQWHMLVILGLGCSKQLCWLMG